MLATCVGVLLRVPVIVAAIQENGSAQPRPPVEDRTARESNMEGEAAPGRAVSGPEIDAALDRVLLRPEYTWRLPRERPVTEEEAPVRMSSSFWENVRETLRKAVAAVVRFLDRIADWLDEHLSRKRPERQKDHVGWQSEVRLLLFIVLAVAASALAIFLYRLFKRRKSLAVEARPLPSAADLLDDGVVANDRPSNEWMTLARELVEQGELRLALRAMFLAALAHLGALEVLTVAAHKSNREYVRELDRRAREAATMRGAFEQNTQALERVWYGRHDVSPQTLDAYTTNQEQILDYGNEPQG